MIDLLVIQGCYILLTVVVHSDLFGSPVNPNSVLGLIMI